MFMLAVFLFVVPSNVHCSKKEKRPNTETEHLTEYDIFIYSYEEDDDVNDDISLYNHGGRREAEELTDHNDYIHYPLCGDKPMWQTYNCYCGNRTLSSSVDLSKGDHYCCVPPSVSGQDQCKYTGPSYYEDDPRHSDVRCENGEVKHKTEPCHQNCWNSYRQSEKLYKTATMYCHKEDYCLPLDQMCSGVCSEEAELCDPDNLRCIGHGYSWLSLADDYTKKSSVYHDSSSYPCPMHFRLLGSQSSASSLQNPEHICFNGRQ